MTAPDFPDGWAYDIYWLGTTANGASADCTILRWDALEPGGDPTVVVIDAGRNADDLDQLLRHLRDEIGRTRIDYLIGTHSDNDHIGNFPKLLNTDDVSIGELWVHDPRRHLDIYEPAATPDAVVASITDVHKINQIADDGIVRHEPFTGRSTPDGVLTILGPSRDYYRSLLPKIFSREDIEGLSVLAASVAIDTKTHQPHELVLPGKLETWDADNLSPSNPSRPSNDVSVISVLQLPGRRQVLFTGDASSRSFDSARAEASDDGFDPDQLWQVQLPHHGSYANVTAALLDELLGPILGSEEAAIAAADQTSRVCIAQAGAADPDHPSGRVCNAAIRRGWHVLNTGGKSWRVGHPAPPEGSTYPRPTNNPDGDSIYVPFDPDPES